MNSENEQNAEAAVPNPEHNPIAKASELGRAAEESCKAAEAHIARAWSDITGQDPADVSIQRVKHRDGSIDFYPVPVGFQLSQVVQIPQAKK